MEIITPSDAPTTTKKVYTIDNFKGIDLSSTPNDIADGRSPDAPNMISDLKGKVQKRQGFELYRSYDGRINGVWIVFGHAIVHAGEKLYIDADLAWEGMNDAKSCGLVIGSELIIADGNQLMVFDGESVYPLEENAYIPTAYIACDPSGGGTYYEDLNLLSNGWRESFMVPAASATTTEFQLSFTGLSVRIVEAKVLNSQGIWEEKTEGTDFTVDRVNGIVTFVTAPGATPITGEDNVIITAYKRFSDYKERINHCTFGIAYNKKGTQNRLFLSGNEDYQNRDWWCQADDPEYFPDLDYSIICGENSKIVGYNIVEGVLATFIMPSYEGRSIYLRELELDDDDRATFPFTEVLQGEEAINTRSFVYMETEPMFLTERGVYAITPADIDGRMYTQNRSYFINNEIRKSDLTTAECTKWKHYYVICIGTNLYLLDTSQKYYYKNEPLSSYQYECYKWTGIDARIMNDIDGVLYFGDSSGNVCRFKTGDTSADFYDYSASGNKEIDAYWTIPDFDGNIFWKNKTIRSIGISAAPYAHNKIVLQKKIDGIWEDLKSWSSGISFFQWSSLVWSEFTWSGNSEYRTLTSKVKIKKFDKVGFRIMCPGIGKAFGLFSFSVEYTETGRYKK